VSLTIALDAMGGDRAPEVVIRGAELARRRIADLSFLVFGDEARVAPLLAARPELDARSELIHTKEVVSDDCKPAVALRQGRQSSMRLAIDAVRDGRAHAAVSAGNTGALMAIAKYVLKTLPGIDRPAIASVMPTRQRRTVVLDLGANVECDPENLVQFAVMGEVYARAVLGVEKPTVGLLNIGTEDYKGGDVVRRAAAMLRTSTLPIEFYGFVEGSDITAGTVDVVVTDGFTGNVALKVAEGTVRMVTDHLREAFRSSWRSRLAYLLARRDLAGLRRRLDPRRYNGAMFLGLAGVVVKSHGGTDEVGFANAIGVASELITRGTNERISRDLTRVGSEAAAGARLAAS
jgi:phosphate acyltransferase